MMHEESSTFISPHISYLRSLRDYIQVLAIIAGTAIVSMNKKVRERENSHSGFVHSLALKLHLHTSPTYRNQTHRILQHLECYSFSSLCSWTALPVVSKNDCLPI
jgi:hypothetical protein